MMPLMQPERPVLIIVRDGWGVREDEEGNATLLAGIPRHEELWSKYPTALVDASGHCVGLPEGQMGSSEVGHTNMGAGRAVYQDLARIEEDLRDGGFAGNEALRAAMDRAQERNRALHLMGLCSGGGIHSHINHLRELLRMARDAKVEEVFVHALTDGRDTDPREGIEHLTRLVGWTQEIGVGRIATVSGRYYAMDRDNRWDRVAKGYEAIVHGRGRTGRDPVQVLEDSYAAEVTDEFVVPTVLVDTEGRPLGPMRRGDQVIAFNFRADRMRQICSALTSRQFDGFARGHDLVFELVGMTRYHEAIPFAGVAYPRVVIDDHLSEYLGRSGLTQFKCAETEKYAHVTFFWNGGVEAPQPGEERLLAPSPRVATYDLQPEMSAARVIEGTLTRLEQVDDALLVVNFANPDMVGHTGNLEATIQAVQTVDDGVGRLVEAILGKGGAAIVTADHGNCELMIDPETGGIHTAHTTNQVHAIVCATGLEGRAVRPDGSLADIAPTALELMGLPQPKLMTGRSLLAPR